MRSTDARPETDERTRSTRTRANRAGGYALLVVAVLLAGVGVRKIGPAFQALVAGPKPDQAIDLRLRYLEVHEWMAGRPVYGVINTAMYPPATYATLWPFVGWTSLATARDVWAVTCFASLVVLLWVACAGAGAGAGRSELRALLAGALLSNYANAVAIGNGQMSLQVVAGVVCGVIVARRGGGSWRADACAAVLFLLGMAKPQIAIPFWFILLFGTGRVRPAVLVVIGYIALTLVATGFQGVHVWADHFRQFRWASVHAMDEGYGNLNIWLGSAGLGRWILPAWVLVLVGWGAWAFVHRRGELWPVMAIAALVARMWSYHRNYDDVLIWIPLIALFRLLGRGVVARSLFAVLVVAMIVPARSGRLYQWDQYIAAAHVAVWLATLVYLLGIARAPDPAPDPA